MIVVTLFTFGRGLLVRCFGNFCVLLCLVVLLLCSGCLPCIWLGFLFWVVSLWLYWLRACAWFVFGYVVYVAACSFGWSSCRLLFGWF